MTTLRKRLWTIRKLFKMLKVLVPSLNNSLTHFKTAIKGQNPLLQVLIKGLIKVSNISQNSK